MRFPWRPLALAAAINVTAALGAATAQTVIVIKAPPAAPLELVLNTATIASTTVGADGTATLDVDLSARRGRNEIDANIYVDECGDLRRVLLVEPGVQAMPAGPACIRREVLGVYVVRGVTTLVVDVSGTDPSVRLRQGPAPEGWLNPESMPAPGSGRSWAPLPTGLVVFGGGGLSMFTNQASVACGNVTDCSGKNNQLAYTAGAAFWFLPFLAAEATYLKPADVTATGSGTDYRFESALETQLATVAGKVGVPIGPMRIYGQAGMAYHRAVSDTSQVVDDYTVTVDGVTQTFPGGTQTFGMKTSGWGLYYGGGAEVWIGQRFAIYGDLTWATLKADADGNGEGSIDEKVMSVLAGLRVRIGR